MIKARKSYATLPGFGIASIFMALLDIALGLGVANLVSSIIQSQSLAYEGGWWMGLIFAVAIVLPAVVLGAIFAVSGVVLALIGLGRHERTSIPAAVGLVLNVLILAAVGVFFIPHR